MTDVAGLLLARAGDDRCGLMEGDRTWSWRQVVAESAARGAWLAGCLDGHDGPPHVGVLLGNVPEYLWWLGAAALAGATVVGINPTRRGDALAADVRRTRCALLVTDASGAALTDGLDLGLDAGVAEGGTVLVDGPDQAAAVHAGADPAHLLARSGAGAGSLFLLLFTSGTTGTPKAVRCTQGRFAGIAARSTAAFGYGPDDVAYCAMPLFHGNALMALWGPSLAVGAAVALAPRFSASGFLPDVRRYGATTFTYVGRALAHVLATPASPDDATCPLRRGFGTEASVADLAAFEERFGCTLIEGYGSSEGGVAINRVPGTPPGSLGKPASDGVVVVDPDSGAECPPARMDAAGRVLNSAEAVGEIVNRDGPGGFEGYYDDPGATAERTRNGWYWTGDLAYRDGRGFFYFAGRRGDWLRVDSENLAAGPVERLLGRFPALAAAAVVGVPDVRSGDRLLAAVEVLPGWQFDADAFGRFLAAQPDLGTKWVPEYLRVTRSLPVTASGKVTKQPLRDAGWWDPGDNELYVLDATARGDAPVYRPLTAADRDRLRAALATHGRDGLTGG